MGVLRRICFPLREHHVSVLAWLSRSDLFFKKKKKNHLFFFLNAKQPKFHLLDLIRLALMKTVHNQIMTLKFVNFLLKRTPATLLT